MEASASNLKSVALTVWSYKHLTPQFLSDWSQTNT